MEKTVPSVELLQVQLHVDDPLEDCWVSNDPPPPYVTPRVNGHPFRNFGQDQASRLAVHSYYTDRQTHKSSFIYLFITCISVLSR